MEKPSREQEKPRKGATWASVQHWYRQINNFDLVVHFFAPGSLAAAVYFVLAEWGVLGSVRHRSDQLRSWAPVVWVSMVGLMAAVVWEIYEWVVEQISPVGMLVGYTDTITDLCAGLLGSLAAGVLVLQWGRRQTDWAQRSVRRRAEGRR